MFAYLPRSYPTFTAGDLNRLLLLAATARTFLDLFIALYMVFCRYGLLVCHGPNAVPLQKRDRMQKSRRKRAKSDHGYRSANEAVSRGYVRCLKLTLGRGGIQGEWNEESFRTVMTKQLLAYMMGQTGWLGNSNNLATAQLLLFSQGDPVWY